jgi:hypothetical protein
MKQFKTKTVGNEGNINKRRSFINSKESAAPLARAIEDAYRARGESRAISREFRDEGISPNTKAKFKR